MQEEDRSISKILLLKQFKGKVAFMFVFCLQKHVLAAMKVIGTCL